MTLLVTLQVVFTTLGGGIQIGRLLVDCEKPRGTGELAGKWFFNRVPSYGGKRPGFCFRYHGSYFKTDKPQFLWLVNTAFSYAGAQRAAVEAKDLCIDPAQVDLGQFAGSNITLTGAKTMQTSLMVCQRLATGFNPADLSIPPSDPKLNLAWF